MTQKEHVPAASAGGTAAPAEQPAAPAAREPGRLGHRLAKEIVGNMRVQALAIAEFGLLMKISAFQDAKQPLNTKLASRFSGMRPAKLRACVDGLLAAGLITEKEDGTLLANSFSSTPAATAAVRRRAAQCRWDQQRERADTHKAEPGALVPAAAAIAEDQAKPAAAPAPVSKPKRTRRKAVVTPAAPGEGVPSLLPKVADVPEAAAVEPGVTQVDMFGDQPPPDTSAMSAAEKAAAYAKLRNTPPPWHKLAQLFNTICKSLTPVTTPTDWPSARCSQLKARWERMPDLMEWEKFFRAVEESDFLCGRIQKFSASFDWIIKQENFIKIWEGNYVNRGGSRKGLWDQGGSQFQAGTYGQHEIAEDAPWMRAAAAVGVQS